MKLIRPKHMWGLRSLLRGVKRFGLICTLFSKEIAYNRSMKYHNRILIKGVYILKMNLKIGMFYFFCRNFAYGIDWHRLFVPYTLKNINGNYFKHISLKASFKYQVNNNPLNIHFIVGYVFAVVAHYAVPFTPIFIVYVYAAI